jgi:hypothetical protein
MNECSLLQWHFQASFSLVAGSVVLSNPVLAESLQQAWQQAEQASNSLRAEARKVAGARQQEAASHAAAGPARLMPASASWTAPRQRGWTSAR